MKFLFIIHPNKQKVNVFPLGPAYLGAVLREKGHEVTMYCMDVFHYTPEELKKYLEENKFDVVGMGFMAARLDFVLECAKAINSIKNKPIFIIGGPGPTPIPEYCLKKLQADITILGEGEIILPDVLDTIENNKPLSEIKGIAYREGDKVYINERREPVKDIDTLPLPAWDLFPIEKYVDYQIPGSLPTDRVMAILSSRGCPYRCNFCYRLEKGVRLRSIDSLVEEMKVLHNKYRITCFHFMDELVMVTAKRTIEICNAIMKAGLKIKFVINGRLNIVNEEVLNVLKKAGCTFVNYGVESYDQKVLNLMKKDLTIEQIDKGLDITIKQGIGVGINIIFGNIGDTKETLQKGVELIRKYYKYDRCRTIRPVTPYPGSDLYDYAIKKGLLKGPEDFFEKNKNSDALTVNFTNMSDEEFYKVLFEVNKEMSRKYYNKFADDIEEAFKKLYFEGDYSFRGARFN